MGISLVAQDVGLVDGRRRWQAWDLLDGRAVARSGDAVILEAIGPPRAVR